MDWKSRLVEWLRTDTLGNVLHIWNSDTLIEIQNYNITIFSHELTVGRITSAIWKPLAFLVTALAFKLIFRHSENPSEIKV